MKRIGILGGSFDPIHNGHIAMAYAALEQCDLEEVVFVPAYISPHKRQEQLKTAKHRYAMVGKALKDHPLFRLSKIEVNAKETSYTIRTIKAFQERYPKNTKFYFLIGADSLKSLHTWKNIDQLQNLVSFVCINRGGHALPKSEIKAKILTMPGLDISSTHIRHRIKHKKDVQFLIPKSVHTYIQENKLYR